MVLALVLYSNGKYEALNLESLEDFQKVVDGYLEYIPIGINCRVTCYVNEEGALRNLQPSPWTSFLRKINLSIHPGTSLRGNILLFGGEPDEEGDETSVEPDIIERARLFHTQYL